MEQLKESDIIWSENHYYHCSNITKNSYDTKEVVVVDSSFQHSHSRLDIKNNNNNKKNMLNSHPITIPSSFPAYSWSNSQPDSYESYFNDDEEDEMVPPHLMVARRLAQNTGFSVCTGTGRTLKGRDLSQVRNSILRMTGFLETE